MLQDYRGATRSNLADQQAGIQTDLLPVTLKHFEEALDHVQASVKADDLVKYMNMPDPMASSTRLDLNLRTWQLLYAFGRTLDAERRHVCIESAFLDLGVCFKADVNDIVMPHHLVGEALVISEEGILWGILPVYRYISSTVYRVLGISHPLPECDNVHTHAFALAIRYPQPDITEVHV